MNKFRALIERNINFIIILFALFFGVLLTTLLAQTKEAANNAEKAAKQSASNAGTLNKLNKTQIKNQNDLIKDNRKQTVILCKLILRGDLSFDKRDEADITKICDESISRVEQGFTQQTSEQPKKSQPNKTKSQPKKSNKPSNPPDNDGIIINLPILPKIHVPSPF